LAGLCIYSIALRFPGKSRDFIYTKVCLKFYIVEMGIIKVVDKGGKRWMTWSKRNRKNLTFRRMKFHLIVDGPRIKMVYISLKG
jgi:hypothetical protein